MCTSSHLDVMKKVHIRFAIAILSFKRYIENSSSYAITSSSKVSKVEDFKWIFKNGFKLYLCSVGT